MLINNVGEPVSAECFLFRFLLDLPEGIYLSLPESTSIARVFLQLVQPFDIQVSQRIAREFVVDDVCRPDPAPDCVWSVQLAKVSCISRSRNNDHSDVHSPRIAVREYVYRNVQFLIEPAK